jgi:ArsR family transcriptional regulator
MDARVERLNELHAEMCKVVTSPVRIQILDLLRDGEHTVSDLAESLGVPQPNVSQHLGIMRAKGILLARKEGVSVHYRLANPKIIKAFDIMREMLIEMLRHGAEVAQGGRSR